MKGRLKCAKITASKFTKQMVGKFNRLENLASEIEFQETIRSGKNEEQVTRKNSSSLNVSD